MTSGGTESILTAVKASRDYMAASRGITEPEMVVAVSAHAAFIKAAGGCRARLCCAAALCCAAPRPAGQGGLVLTQLASHRTSQPNSQTMAPALPPAPCPEYFKIRLVKVQVGRDYRLSGAAVRAALSANTVLVVASAPGFPHGLVDHVEDIAAVRGARGCVWWRGPGSTTALTPCDHQTYSQQPRRPPPSRSLPPLPGAGHAAARRAAARRLLPGRLCAALCRAAGLPRARL